MISRCALLGQCEDMARQAHETKSILNSRTDSECVREVFMHIVNGSAEQVPASAGDSAARRTFGFPEGKNAKASGRGGYSALIYSTIRIPNCLPIGHQADGGAIERTAGLILYALQLQPKSNRSCPPCTAPRGPARARIAGISSRTERAESDRDCVEQCLSGTSDVVAQPGSPI